MQPKYTVPLNGQSARAKQAQAIASGSKKGIIAGKTDHDIDDRPVKERAPIAGRIKAAGSSKSDQIKSEVFKG